MEVFNTFWNCDFLICRSYIRFRWSYLLVGLSMYATFSSCFWELLISVLRKCILNVRTVVHNPSVCFDCFCIKRLSIMHPVSCPWKFWYVFVIILSTHCFKSFWWIHQGNKIRFSVGKAAYFILHFNEALEPRTVEWARFHILTKSRVPNCNFY